jgi:hypothetical protein
MTDSARAIVKDDGDMTSSDAHAKLACSRCDRSVYVYADKSGDPVTIGDLPSFCRDCGQAYEVWSLEYIHGWELSKL